MQNSIFKHGLSERKIRVQQDSSKQTNANSMEVNEG